jgi:hypothetical protein
MGQVPSMRQIITLTLLTQPPISIEQPAASRRRTGTTIERLSGFSPTTNSSSNEPLDGSRRHDVMRRSRSSTSVESGYGNGVRANGRR